MANLVLPGGFDQASLIEGGNSSHSAPVQNQKHQADEGTDDRREEELGTECFRALATTAPDPAA